MKYRYTAIMTTALGLCSVGAVLGAGSATLNLDREAYRAEQIEARNIRYHRNAMSAPATKLPAPSGVCSLTVESSTRTWKYNYACVFRDGHYLGLAVAANDNTLQVDPGTYTVISFAYNRSDDAAALLLENVEVTGDMTYTPDFSRCTNLQKFRVTLPDGSTAHCNLLDGDTYDVIEEGNILFGTWALYFHYGDKFQALTNGFVMDAIKIDEDFIIADEDCGNMYVNPDAEGLTIIQDRICVTPEGGCFTNMASTPDMEGLVTNPTDGYKYFDAGLMPTRHGLAPTLDMSGYSTVILENGYPRYNDLIAQQNIGNGVWPNTDKMWVNYNRELADMGFDVYVLPVSFETPGKDFQEQPAHLGVTGCPVSNLDGCKQNYYPHALGVNGNVFMYAEGGDDTYYPFHPAYSYTPEQKEGDYCNSTPLLVTASNWKPDGSRRYLNGWTGRYGETRGSDRALMTEDRDITKTTITYTYTNANGMVDGQECTNTATVHFSVNASGDCEAPTTTALQFRNTATGKVTDRFDNRADGRMMINATDHAHILAPPMQWYVQEEPELTVEYAPASTEDWRVMDVNRCEELDMFPAWGYGYDASLATVEGPAGWYSMRIRVEDEMSNYQEQVLSHAFYLADSAGMQAVGAESVDTRWFGIDGVETSAPQRGGVYIMQHQGRPARKVTVR